MGTAKADGSAFTPAPNTASFPAGCRPMSSFSRDEMSSFASSVGGSPLQ
jgi:hypothetical protein